MNRVCKPIFASKKIFVTIVLPVVFSFNLLAQQSIADEAKIEQLIKQMTIEEKVNMIHASSSFTSGGVPRLGIPEMVMSDGPHGVRMEHGRDWMVDQGVNDSCTYLPTGTALAATWNPDLGYEFGSVLGSEAKFRGKDVILGPGINIIRTPLNGRNFEYLSEDPYLASKMVVGCIRGIQDQGISACVKHYLANNQEKDRTTVDVMMSERTLREIYLPGFKAAVQEGGVNTVMGSYNKFRGQYATHNKYLVNDILKGEFGFKGLLMSDWGAVHNTMEAIKNGCDIEMGTDLNQRKADYSKFFMGDTVVKLVKGGVVPESLIDDKVRRILRVMFKTNMLGGNKRTPGEFSTKAHQQSALKIAREAITLLKNDKVLPLQPQKLKNLLVIGANATRKHAGQGGSSQVNAKYEITPLEGIKTLLGKSVAITYTEGYRVTREKKFDQEPLMKEAVKLAQSADAVIIVGGLIRGWTNSFNDNAYDCEGPDKQDMFLPFGQDKLIRAVLEVSPNAVVALVGGSAVDMTAWADKAKAIVQAWYAGMEGGNALAEVLFGKINPSGKLPMTFPKTLEESPAHKLGEYPGVNKVEHYNEGVFVGYRYFDSYKVDPQFCFGHGLSYTQFLYKNLKINTESNPAKVTLTVKNTGKMAGAEVVQVYVGDPEASVHRPDKELKAFQKVFLNPGESKTIELQLPESSFQFFDETRGMFALEPGRFTISVGSSSRDIRLKGALELK
jgi:beta-glucosidase